jgi:hypothetical protein
LDPVRSSTSNQGVGHSSGSAPAALLSHDALGASANGSQVRALGPPIRAAALTRYRSVVLLL